MKIAECMTQDIEIVSPDQPIQEAARFMLRADSGVMPVSEGDRLVGMVTDRDIAVRAVAEGRGPDTPFAKSGRATCSSASTTRRSRRSR
jgi:CBS domain-containing protein